MSIAYHHYKITRLREKAAAAWIEIFRRVPWQKFSNSSALFAKQDARFGLFIHSCFLKSADWIKISPQQSEFSRNNCNTMTLWNEGPARANTQCDKRERKTTKHDKSMYILSLNYRSVKTQFTSFLASSVKTFLVGCWGVRWVFAPEWPLPFFTISELGFCFAS